MLFEPFWAPGKPQNSSHSIISGGEKRDFLAFGCDFEGKKCLEQRKTQGFEASGKAKTLYFTNENALFFKI